MLTIVAPPKMNTSRFCQVRQVALITRRYRFPSFGAHILYFIFMRIFSRQNPKLNLKLVVLQDTTVVIVACCTGLVALP